MKPPSTDLKVLIVDDEKDVGFLIRTILESKGLSVAVAYSASDCLAKAREFQPTHIILDINLPDGNGLDLLPKLKSMAPSTEVFMHSAQDTAENRRMAAAHGANAFLKKPLNKKQLLQLFTTS